MNVRRPAQKRDGLCDQASRFEPATVSSHALVDRNSLTAHRKPEITATRLIFSSRLSQHGQQGTGSRGSKSNGIGVLPGGRGEKQSRPALGSAVKPRAFHAVVHCVSRARREIRERSASAELDFNCTSTRASCVGICTVFCRKTDCGESSASAGRVIKPKASAGGTSVVSF